MFLLQGEGYLVQIVQKFDRDSRYKFDEDEEVFIYVIKMEKSIKHMRRLFVFHK